MLYTTLNDIKSYHPCKEGWTKLLKHLGKIKADNDKLDFRTILNSNGINDALWCVKALGKPTRVSVALAYVNSVKHLITSKDCLNTLLTCQQYIDGRATDEQLKNAAYAAYADAADAVAAYAYDADADADAYAAAAAYAYAADADVADAAAYAAYAAFAAYAYAADADADVADAADYRRRYKLKIFVEFLDGDK
jgi:hypothetical protein